MNDELSLFVSVEDVFESVKTAELKFYFENSDKVKVATGTVLIGINL
jgi:hypothetical protein